MILVLIDILILGFGLTDIGLNCHIGLLALYILLNWIYLLSDSGRLLNMKESTMIKKAIVIAIFWETIAVFAKLFGLAQIYYIIHLTLGVISCVKQVKKE